MNTRHVISRLSAVAIAFALSAGICGCDSETREGIKQLGGCVYPDPPVSITFRPSLLEGLVLQLHNTSLNRHVYTVHVRNNKGQKANVAFAIPPNNEQEVGLLEMLWAFKPGDNGHVKVDGYSKKCYFVISSGGLYTTWYGL